MLSCSIWFSAPSFWMGGGVVSALSMSVAHLLLSRLFELASLWVVQFGCLYLVVGI